MNPKFTAVAVVAVALLFFGGRFVQTVPPGHVAVAVLFGEVVDVPYEEGLHIPVNPLYSWEFYDIREKTHKETAQVPTQDQLQTRVDVSVQYRLNGSMAPQILQDVGNQQAAISVYLTPKQGQLPFPAHQWLEEARLRW